MVDKMKNASYKAEYGKKSNLLRFSISKTLKSRYQRSCAFVFLLLMPFLSFADKLTVKADRQTIEMGDLITLQVEADFQTSGSQLNLESLNDQFEVLGRQQSNRISVTNGKFSSTTAWQVTLLPKHIGELVIPPLEVADVKSEPFKITVTPVQKKSAQNRGSYFVESSLNKNQAYIQEEVLYSLKLYFLGNFTGSVRAPQFENALSVTLKDQNVYGKHLNGEQYTVYEWQYALYPQQSGEMTIKGPVFSGIHLYRGRQKGIQEAAENHPLKVLAAPYSFSQTTDDSWLPAKAVKLAERWQSLPKTVRVGDSLNRNLTLDVVGLKASQLPQLTTENQAGFKVYADQAESEEAIIQDGLRSQLQISQAIIPTQEGVLTLPEQSVHWWNTESQKIETATISARTFTVLPALNTSHQNGHTNQKGADVPIQIIRDTHQSSPSILPDVSRETSFYWTLVTIILGLAWFVTLGLWYRQNKKFKALMKRLEQSEAMENQSQPNAQIDLGSTPTIAPTSHKSHSSSLCEQTDLTASAFYHQLRTELSDRFAINHFAEIEYAPLKEAINQLENHLFNQTAFADDTLKTICNELQNFATLQQQVDESDSQSKRKLAKLYEQ